MKAMPHPPAGARVVPFGAAAVPISDDTPDADLVAAARGGDRAAFEALLRRHYDRMHRIAWRLTGSSSDADDVTQEVCCSLVEKLKGFRGEAKFTTWLFGIVVNACRDQRRRTQSLLRLRHGLSVLAGLAAAPDGRELYRRGWMASELARLAPDLRETIVLVIGEDLSHGEAARALGIAESTVSWRLHEARRQLSAKSQKEVRDDL